MELFMSTIVFAAIYIVLAVSFDLILGYAQLLSVAHASFFAIGGYTTALLATKGHVPVVFAGICGMGVAGVLSTIVAGLAVRVASDYLVIATFGFQIIVIDCITNLTSVTGGPIGLSNIPPPGIFGWNLSSPVSYVVIFGAIATIVLLVVWWISRSPFGRVLRPWAKTRLRPRLWGSACSTRKYGPSR